MARQGETIENPATGERITFRETAESTGGDLLQFDYELRPGGAVVAGHAHPNQEETMGVRRGALDVSIDGDRWRATPGTKFSIPPDVDHRVWNDGDEPVEVRVELRPALRLETFFETLFGLARDGKTDARGRPSPLQLAVLADEYRAEFRFARAPTALQRAAATALAPVGKAVGYRATYPEYGPERPRATPGPR